ncbi:MAG: hypothetical protein ACK5JT_11075 [Hyphomicrobiaceae bacterium]
MATVSGSGSIWTVTSSLYVGDDQNATATLNVLNGATLNLGSNRIYISDDDSTGIFNVSGGSTVISGEAIFGNYSDTGRGIANISGLGTTWTISDDLTLGYEGGSGELNITQGAVVSAAGDLTMGYYDEGVTRGDLLISGPGSRLTIGGSAAIGDDRPAIVSVSNGGFFGVTGDAQIARDTTAPSTVTVTGADSRFEANNLAVGDYGEGTLNVLDGGSVQTNNLTMGHNTGGVGTLLVDGPESHVQANSSIIIGFNGTGTTTVSNGGWLESQGTLTIGDLGSGSLVVTGIGSRVTTGSDLIVGDGAEGSLTISNGGKVIVNDGAGNTFVGSQQPLTRTVTVDGAGSELRTNILNLGINGTGIATVSNGGTITANKGLT